MKRYVLAILVVGLVVSQGYCQENQVSNNQDTSQVAGETAVPDQTESVKAANPEEISIYGEIKAVNVAANSITVQYYDYDSDEEKSIEITSDSNTKMENATAITDIKQGNWADVIYTVANGKNIAKSIIVEKEEEAPAEMPKPEAMPQEAPKQ